MTLCLLDFFSCGWNYCKIELLESFSNSPIFISISPKSLLVVLFELASSSFIESASEWKFANQSGEPRDRRKVPPRKSKPIPFTFRGERRRDLSPEAKNTPECHRGPQIRARLHDIIPPKTETRCNSTPEWRLKFKSWFLFDQRWAFRVKAITLVQDVTVCQT